jgi:hypothetical protein
MIILLMLLLLVPSQAGNPRLDTSITDEEYSIYSVLINSAFLHPKTQLAIIKAHTEFERESVVIPEEFKEDLLSKIERSETLERRFSLKVEYLMLNKDLLETIFKEGSMKGWERYWKEYPNATGVLGFSRIGFDRAHNKAFVYVSETCGTLCGNGYAFRLEKINGSWQVKEKKNLWIA